MNEQEFKQEVLPLKNKLYRQALLLTRNDEEAKDVVQDTFLKLWNSRQQKVISSYEALAYTICRRVALDKIQKKEYKNISLDIIETPVSNDTPQAKLLHKEKKELLAKWIQSLPELHQKVLHLREVEEKSYKEIANVLNISEDLVKVSLHRARQRLKQTLIESEKNEYTIYKKTT